MFTDETLEIVGAGSLWRKSRQLEQESKSCQTAPLQTAEVEVQSLQTSDSGTQTDADELWAQRSRLAPPSEQEAPGLGEFLLRVEGTVVKELAKNAKSHAFSGFEVNWEDRNQTVTRLHCLQYTEAQDRRLHVTSVSWSSTGSVIACAYGRVDDGDWSTEQSFVCTWNLDRRGLNPKRPDLVIDVPAPVMCLAFHPSQPSLIAGGLYSGQVVVWDTSRTQDPVFAQTGMSADAHREPVYQVCWVPGPRRGEQAVLSAGSGGRALRWRVDGEGRLALSAGYALAAQQIPRSGALSKARGSGAVGVTSLALSPWDSDVFLLGSEGGLVLKCSFSAQAAAAGPPGSESQSVTLRAPAQFSFAPRCGPVHALHCSPFHRNLFVSAGTDGLAHIHSLLQASPVLSVRVCDAYVFGVRWSPTRPLLLAAATGQGSVLLFDLGRGSLRPTATIEHSAEGMAVSCLEYNPRQTDLLAAGGADGTVSIWQLSPELTEQGPREVAQLEQIAHEVAE
ncbi:cytoplasmic dynein 2 intermediate chain 2 isoform X1 [Lepisosteus oculatus]